MSILPPGNSRNTSTFSPQIISFIYFSIYLIPPHPNLFYLLADLIRTRLRKLRYNFGRNSLAPLFRLNLANKRQFRELNVMLRKFLRINLNYLARYITLVVRF